MTKDIVETSSDTGNWYILTVGLPPITDSLTLASGVSLRPIGNPLSVFDLAGAGAVGFKEWAVLEPVAHACTCEIESAHDASMGEETPMPLNERQIRYTSYLNEAEQLARKHQKQGPSVEYVLGGALGDLQFFALPECCMTSDNKTAGKRLVGKIKTIFSRK